MATVEGADAYQVNAFEKFGHVPVWARQQGAPFWPSRICSPVEAVEIERHRPPKTKNASSNSHVAVFFFANKQKGWVNMKSIFLFEPANFTKCFDPKKFAKNREYKDGVLEALRVMTGRRRVIPDNILAMVRTDSQTLMSPPQKCIDCHGTVDSGFLLTCMDCFRHCHMHCIRPTQQTRNFRWRCRPCDVRRLQGLPPESMEPAPSQNGTHISQPRSQATSSQINTSSSSAAIAPSTANTIEARNEQYRNHHLTNMSKTPRPLVEIRPRPPFTAVLPITQYTANENEPTLRATPVAKPPEKWSPFDCEVAPHENRAINAISGQTETTNPSNTSRETGPKSASSLLTGLINAKKQRKKTVVSETLNENEGNTNSNGNDADNDSRDEESEDKCFVCGMQGSVIMCDFPRCRKVYHQSCVCKCVPEPLGDDSLSPNGESRWFCPHHFCSKCNKLEDVEGIPSSALNPPSYVYINGPPLQAELRKCDECPLSVCAACDVPHQVLNPGHGHGWSPSLFFKNSLASRAKRKNACRNCVGRNSHLKLVKVLEKSWGSMCASRLAIPFMRPFLPILQKESQAAAPVEQKQLDFVRILEKIRKWEYSSASQYRDDLERLRVQCKEVLTNLGALSHDSFRGLHGKGRMLLDALESVIEDGNRVLEMHSKQLEAAEKSVERGLEAADTEAHTSPETGAGGGSDEEQDEVVGEKELNAEARMYWRKECEREPDSKAGALRVHPRSLDGWCFYVSEGAMRPQGVATDDLASYRERRVVRKWLTNDLPIEDVMSREDASQALLSMSRRWDFGGSDWRSKNMILEEAIRNAMETQHKLTQQLHKIETYQRETIQEVHAVGSDGLVTIGEAHLLQELRIANDAFRWSLQRKDEIIAKLKENNKLRELNFTKKIAEKDKLIKESDAILLELNQMIAKKEKMLQDKSNKLADLEFHMTIRNRQLMEQDKVVSNLKAFILANGHTVPNIHLDTPTSSSSTEPTAKRLRVDSAVPIVQAPQSTQVQVPMETEGVSAEATNPGHSEGVGEEAVPAPKRKRESDSEMQAQAQGEEASEPN